MTRLGSRFREDFWTNYATVLRTTMARFERSREFAERALTELEGLWKRRGRPGPPPLVASPGLD